MSPPTAGSSILMISAPRSASTWVPKGPAPNWETARMRTPSRGGLAMSVGKFAFSERGVALLRHEDLSRVGTDLVSTLVCRDRLDGDDAAVALLRLPQLPHAAHGVQRVADERGLLVLERVHLEIGDGAPRNVGDAHADDDAEDQRAQHHALLVLGVGLGKMRVGMQRVLVHGEEREPRAVPLGDGAPGPVIELLSHRELLEVAPVAHGVPGSTAWRAMARRRVSSPASPARSAAASR